MYISTPPSPEVENLLPRRGSNPGLTELEADELPSEPARRAFVQKYAGEILSFWDNVIFADYN